MNNKTIKARLMAGLTSFIMLFSILTASMGAVLAEEAAVTSATTNNEVVTETKKETPKAADVVTPEAPVSTSLKQEEATSEQSTESAAPVAAQAAPMAAAAVNASGLQANQMRFSFQLPSGWNSQDFSNFVVNYVDMNGKPLNLSAYSIDNSQTKVIICNDPQNVGVGPSEFQLTLGSKAFVKAQYRGVHDSSMKDFDRIRFSTRPDAFVYNYDFYSGNSSSPVQAASDFTVNLVYPQDLTEAVTIDNQILGVDVQMFNYDINIRGWHQWNNGKITQNLIEKELKNIDGEYLPVPKDTLYKDKLIEKFSTKKTNPNYKGAANNLFRADKYDNDGAFYYNSFENYAYWNQPKSNTETGKFTVYNEIGTPNDVNVLDYQRGNFMPYNPIEAGKISSRRNSYDEYGMLLVNDGTNRYGEVLYRTQKAEKPTEETSDGAGKGDGINDYYFGMTTTAEFAQLENGQYNGKDMVYEFNGDDDIWVFIDGVLVLDLGGIHVAQSGYINFASGEVGWYDVTSGGIRPEKPTTTTIKKAFEGTSKEKTTDWKRNGQTFADNTGHEIKIFYMERGAGASNCKMNFNLPILPKNSITVAKEVTNINEGSYNDVNFDFKLYVENPDAQASDANNIVKDGVVYAPQTNTPYQLKEGNTDSKNASTNEKGVFTLKHGQQAYFEEIIEKGVKYIVEETNVKQSNYDQFTANGEALNQEGGNVSSDDAGNTVVRTNPIAAGTGNNSNFVTFKNQCSGSNLHTLNITKKMTDGQKTEDAFALQVKIGGRDFAGTYNIVDVNGTRSENIECVSGQMSIKVGETIEIPQIAADTSFEVTEVELDTAKYKNPVYGITEAKATTTQGKAAGTIVYGQKQAKVSITNTTKTSGLKIRKTIDKANDIDGDPIFTFKITKLGENDKVEEVLYRTLRFDKNGGNSLEITIPNLPTGNYKVEELNTLRYTCTSDKVQTKAVVEEQITDFEFTNSRTSEGNYSHTDMVENSFRVDESGKLVCDQNKTPEGQQSVQVEATQTIAE